MSALCGQDHQNQISNQQQPDLLQTAMTSARIQEDLPSTPDETINFTWSSEELLASNVVTTENQQPPTDTDQQLSELFSDLDAAILQWIGESMPVEDQAVEQAPTSIAQVEQERMQEMLDPSFADSHYVNKIDMVETVKIGQMVTLNVSPTPLEDQDVLVAIYHSHPDFVQHTISGITRDKVKKNIAPNDTPFFINHLNVVYRDILIPDMNMWLKGAVVTLTGQKQISIQFNLTSTDQDNQGHLKDGREWHLLILPLSKSCGQVLRDTKEGDGTVLTTEDIVPYSFLRIQVKTESRKNSSLSKDNRKTEIDWPVRQKMKRKRLEAEYVQMKKRKLAQLSDTGLEQKVLKMKRAGL